MTTTAAAGAVVVGYDATSHSDTALAWAVEYAEGHRRPLLIVHAAGMPTVYESPTATSESRRELDVEGRRVADLALAQARSLASELEVRVQVYLGSARHVLPDCAPGAHLLVVGSRGHGSVGSLLLGSVSVGVSTQAPCPVAVVREPERRDPDSAFAGRVVVGVDGSDTSPGALDVAFEMASERGLAMSVVHAWGGDYLYSERGFREAAHEIADEHERLVAERLAGYAEKYPDVEVTTRHDEGAAGRMLAAASRDAELVVVGSRGRGDAAATLFGSVSRYVVEHAGCPVVVVRRGVHPA